MKKNHGDKRDEIRRTERSLGKIQILETIDEKHCDDKRRQRFFHKPERNWNFTFGKNQKWKRAIKNQNQSRKNYRL